VSPTKTEELSLLLCLGTFQRREKNTNLLRRKREGNALFHAKEQTDLTRKREGGGGGERGDGGGFLAKKRDPCAASAERFKMIEVQGREGGERCVKRRSLTYRTRPTRGGNAGVEPLGGRKKGEGGRNPSFMAEG